MTFYARVVIAVLLLCGACDDGAADSSNSSHGPADAGGGDAGGHELSRPDAGTHSPAHDAMVDAATGDAAGPEHDAAADVDRDAEVEPAGSCELAQPSVSMGSSAEPVVVELEDLPLHGEVDLAQPSYFRIAGATPGAKYELVFTGSDQLRLLAFGSDASFTNAVCAYGPYYGALPARCPVTATTTDLYVAVTALIQAGSFTIELAAVPLGADGADEGTLSAPIQVALAQLPYTGEVDGFEHASQGSYYEITGLTPHQRYAVSAVLDTEESMNVAVFDGLATPVQLDYGYGFAIGRPTTDSLIVRVSGSRFGAGVTFDIDVPTNTSEGTRAAPVVIDYAVDRPFVGKLGWSKSRNSSEPGASSYYVITGLQAGTYAVTLSSTENAELSAYGNSATYETPTCFAQSTSDAHAECLARTTGGELYLRAANRQGLGGSFELDIEPASLQPEGTVDAPVPVALTSLPRASQIAPDVDSVYRVTGLTPGVLYTVQARDTDHLLDLMVRETASPSEVLCSLAAFEVSAMACSFVAPDTSIDIEVDDGVWAGFGASFTLDVVADPNRSEGTADEPVQIPCTGTTYEGHVDPIADSYYEITDLRPGVAYVISLRSRGAELGLWSAPDGACSLSPHAGGADRCVVVASHGALRLQVGSPYQTAFELTVSEPNHLSEGALDAPLVVPGSALPYVGGVNGSRPSYYRITGLDPNAAYFAVVTSQGSGYLVSDTGLLAPGVLNANSSEPGVQSPLGYPGRMAVSGHSTLDLTVADFDSTFTIALEPVPHQSEGTTTPLALPLAQLPYTGAVDGSHRSEYAISGLVPGTAYFASITPTESSTWLQLSGLVCGPNDGRSGAFVATNTTATLYVVTSRDGSGTFELNVAPSLQPEGTPDVPLAVALNELPYEATASCVARSWYAITGVTPGTSYVFSAAMTSGAPIILGADNVFNEPATPARCMGTRCEILATGSTIYISATGTDAAGASYVIDVAQVSYVSEGTADAPVELVLSGLPHAGSITSSGRSYYRITGLVPAVEYDVTIANALGLTHLAIADHETRQLLCDTRRPQYTPNYGLSPRCIVTPTGSTLDVEVIGHFSAGTTYELDVSAY